MIKVNNKIIEPEWFPDGTLNLKFDPWKLPDGKLPTITWLYENDYELFFMICLRERLAEKYSHIQLFLPYLPNARMDRVKNPEDTFTLKYFCKIINDLNFCEVVIFDPHSDVAPALLDRAKIIKPDQSITDIYNELNFPTLFYPDTGAMKRYTFKGAPYAYGNKVRDWETGRIQSLEIINAELVKDRDILIIDDICSKGGTFYHAAKKLKELGAKDIYLYVSHLETSVYLGEMYHSGLIKTIYTTNSIFPHGSTDYIRVKDIW